MTTLAIAGCGIIGAILAYELSCLYPNDPELEIRVIDRQQPARDATRAALGLTIGALSLKKVKSRAWKLRRDSLKRYATLLPELEVKTGRTIPGNCNGILKLCTNFKPTLEKWRTLSEKRRKDGFRLDLLTPEAAKARFPEIDVDRAVAAVHSIDDRQIEPVPLVMAAVEAARLQGVQFDFDGQIEACVREDDRIRAIKLRRSSGTSETISVDTLIVAAGAGSATIANSIATPSQNAPLEIVNVLGQALHVQLQSPFDPALPVLTCDDIHVVPRANGTLWVGATVEFPVEAGVDPVPDPNGLDRVWEAATALYPALAGAKVLSSWQGMRPRPIDRSAPVIEPLAGLANVLLVTAHYRNGVLLAPATAQRAIDWLQQTQLR